MNSSNLLVLSVIYSVALLLVLRTERKRKWLAVLIMLAPIGYMTYQWGILKDQLDVVLAAAGIASSANLLFWILWGRRHPPGSTDSIHVVGMED